MKAYKIILFVFWTSVGFISCENIQNKMKSTDQLMNWNEFSSLQQEDWSKIYDAWLNNKFFKQCMKVHEFKMDCIDCSDVLIIVEITIDANGKIQGWKELEDHIDCPNKKQSQINALKKCIQETFMQLVFPKSLRGIKYRTVLGEQSMC